jgi:hypothetical protein
MKNARKRPSAAKLRSWRVSIIRKRGQYVGTVEAPNDKAAEAAAVAEFDLSDEQRRRLVGQEAELLLASTDIPDDEAFEFLKRLSAAIRSLRDTTLGYDETKPFARFLWEVFAGWDWITGYRKADIIKQMIESI